MRPVWVALLAVLLAAATSPNDAAFAKQASASFRSPDHDDLVLRWNGVILEAIRRSRLGPPIVARALAIVHTCTYDAWAAFDPNATGTHRAASSRKQRGRHDRDKREAVSFAAYRAFVDLFPTQQSLADQLMLLLGYDPLNAIDPRQPAAVGTAVCDAVLAFRHTDGSNQLGDLNGGEPYSDYTGYNPVNTPEQINDVNRWQPLTFTDGRTPGFLTPHWGLVAPFALDAGDALRPGPPTVYPDESYTQQAEELLHLSANLTDRQKMTAEYWADGPSSELPPGHWNVFAQFVSRRERQSLDESVKLFFLLNNALFDTSIAVWDCKRFYDYVRPITAIRFLFAGQAVEAWGGPFQGRRTIDGKDWLPYQPGTFLTPPFAEYPSGHSAFSAAAAEILKLFTGSDFFGASVVLQQASSRIERGLTPRRPVVLFWPTFSAAADEAGRSRRYGGIHFRAGDVEGRALGRAVAALVWAKGQQLFGASRPTSDATQTSTGGQ